MTLPRSFAVEFKQPTPSRYKGILIGSEGGANSGKTEFAWSAPGPAIHLALDKGHSGVLESQTAPESRTLIDGENLLILPISSPMNTGTTKEQAQALWREFYGGPYMKALSNVDARTVILDGDSDSFEWQMLAEFGRTTQIPQIQRTSLNSARRVMISRAWESRKIVIFTNKLKRKYENVFDAAGNPVMDPQKPAEQKRDWDGKSYERQGFNDHEYLFELQLRHLYKRGYVTPGGKEIPGKWGVQILMAKANRPVEGDELWGDDCNLQSVLMHVYPSVDLSEWGY